MPAPPPNVPGAVTRVLIADDHPLLRAGLAALLRTAPDLALVAEASDGAAAVAGYREHRPDVALVDIRMPVVDGIAAIREIRGYDPAARVVALTTYDGDSDIRQALAAGAQGYLLKDMLEREVLDAIRAVARGQRVVPPAVAARLASYAAEPHLTARELDVLRLVARGDRNKQIARALGLTDGTVKVHVKHILEKLGADDRTGAVAIALRRGLVHVDW